MAGYNYMESRFEMDGELYPHRAIVATETHPAAIDTGWAGVVDNPHVIGDFVWTGWDYLGEAGVGRTVYVAAGRGRGTRRLPGGVSLADRLVRRHRHHRSSPTPVVLIGRLSSGCGRTPTSPWGDLSIMARLFGATPWSWSDVVSSWSWEGHEGAPVTVEVYADADEVELLVNGKSVGSQPAGKANRYRAIFETVFEPGRIEAVARRRGTECGRTEIRSATGPVQLEATVDRC